MSERMLTSREAAARLGVGVSQVLRLCASGSLPGARHTSPDNPHRGAWEIPEAAVERRIMEARHPSGKRCRPSRRICLCYTERPSAEVSDRVTDEDRANAALIAAAPELAEALASLVWDVNNGLDPKRSLELAYAAQEKAGLI